MTRIGLLSDTHGYLPEGLIQFFKDCDEIWHAGDIGNLMVIKKLEKLAPLVRFVYGNIDGYEIRTLTAERLNFKCENISVFMLHIGGYPGRYPMELKNILLKNKPQLFICGHSHILKVIYDKELNLLHINPGAAGKEGFHVFQTAVRFVIEKSDIKDLQI